MRAAGPGCWQRLVARAAGEVVMDAGGKIHMMTLRPAHLHVAVMVPTNRPGPECFGSGPMCFFFNRTLVFRFKKTWVQAFRITQ